MHFVTKDEHQTCEWMVPKAEEGVPVEISQISFFFRDSLSAQKLNPNGIPFVVWHDPATTTASRVSLS